MRPSKMLKELGQTLSELAAPGAFCVKTTRGGEDLHLEVRGVGRLRFPVPDDQARKLCDIARPAKYGQGEKTLLDRSVRDTWEIPKSRIKIGREWEQTLHPVLEELGADLGLTDGSRLKAEFHSLLVYEPGQFFLPHQDSEKADGMIGTLVVTLPSSFRGGALVVEHQGEVKSFRGSEKYLSFVAFYADCLHEIRPVTEGYRISLTYNLILKNSAEAVSRPDSDQLETVCAYLEEHFETEQRFIYLFDHEYTEHGLDLRLLKGADAARGAILQAAADRLDCAMMLALAEVRETWSCFEPYSPNIFDERRRWGRDQEGDWYEEEPEVEDPDDYSLEELCDWGTALTHWFEASGKPFAGVPTQISDKEICFSTPSVEIRPYASEYEGFTGNAGNTMDRWYRRAALVIWPSELDFAVRGEASPMWALDELSRLIQADDLEGAWDSAELLEPFWESAARGGEGRGVLEKALQVAVGLDDSDFASMLLRPFAADLLTQSTAASFAALWEGYGEEWLGALLASWREEDDWDFARERRKSRSAWPMELSRVCEELREIGEAAGKGAATLLLRDFWRGERQEIEHRLGVGASRRRAEGLTESKTPLRVLLTCAEKIGAEDLLGEATQFLCDSSRIDQTASVLSSVLREMAETEQTLAPSAEKIREHCVRRLEELVGEPTREENDWSIAFQDPCECDLCATLRSFLADREEIQMEWPIAKRKRMHVHRQIDAWELPVKHATRRKGSPYTLVLTKQRELFDAEIETRRQWTEDLETLRLLGAGEDLR